MKKLLRKIYQSLPVIRELVAIKQTNSQSARVTELTSRVLASTAIIQTLATLKASHERYRDPVRLLVHGAQYWSQNHEDGMIAEIFRRIGTGSRTFLEIGVGDGSENNTTALLTAGWSGWWIEGDNQFHERIAARLKSMPTLASRLNVRPAFVSPENINGILKELGIPSEVDLFSLDIDLNTYHIWAALKDFRPRVVVVEYNAGIPPGQAWVHPFEPDKVWDYTQDQGASLKAYELLGRNFGYSLVGCDLTGLNAFFVRNDLVGDQFAAPFTAENHHEPARPGLTYRLGHGSKFYGETDPSVRF